jgi:hypothetical protein
MRDINIKKSVKISLFLIFRLNKNFFSLISLKKEEKILYPKIFRFRGKNNVFPCKNQKLDLKKSVKRSIDLSKLFFISFDIITLILSAKQSISRLFSMDSIDFKKKLIYFNIFRRK